MMKTRFFLVAASLLAVLVIPLSFVRAADSVEGFNHSYTVSETTVNVTSNNTSILTQNLSRISFILNDETGATNTTVGLTNATVFAKGVGNIPVSGSYTNRDWQGAVTAILINTNAVGIFKTNSIRAFEFLKSPNQN